MSEMTIEEKIALLRDLSLEFEPMIKRIAQLKREIADELLATGEKPDVFGVKVTFRKGSETLRWDSKALEGYAAANPEISQFAKLTVTKPSVSFKFGL